jgi:hypothetical protein
MLTVGGAAVAYQLIINGAKLSAQSSVFLGVMRRLLGRDDKQPTLVQLGLPRENTVILQP